MGYAVGYYSESFPLKLSFYFLISLCFIFTPIFSLLRFLRVPHFQDPSFESFHNYYIYDYDPTVAAAIIEELLPAAKFGRDVAMAATEEESCAVCLSEFEVGEDIRWLKSCGHVFHRGCVDRWIELDRNTCPLCRTQLVPRHMQDE